MSQPTSAEAKSSISDKFAETVLEETGKTAFELGWNIIRKLGTKAWQEAHVRKAMSDYAAAYNDRYGQVKLFGASTPIPLWQIYTEAQIVRTDFLSAFTDPKDMEADFRKAGRQHISFRSKTTRLDSIHVANERQFLNLLGSPGAGKSTFLRQLGQRALLGRKSEGKLWQKLRGKTVYRHARLPVLIELRRFKSEPIDLLKALSREFATCGFPESEKFVEGALHEGALLVLLDGLDEVPDAKLSEVVEHVRDFVDRYSRRGPDGNRFVTSCRTAHYKGFFQKFTDVVLADFSDEQIDQFVRNRFISPDDLNDQTAQRFLSELRKPENLGSLELARSPLLLGFLCVTFEHRQELPATRGKLYQRALDILLREWSASKRVHDEPAYKELNTDLELDLLAEMAEELFREDRFFFSRDWAKGKIRSFMQNVLNAPKSLDAEQILAAIEIQQGLIVKRAQDSYSFSHLTIQEYLTAKRVWEAGESAWLRLIEDHLFEPRWAVVFELMAGFAKADDLLLKIAARCQREWTRDGILMTVLTWIDRNLEKPAEWTLVDAQKLALTRCSFLALSLRGHFDAFIFDFTLDLLYGLALDLAHCIALDLDHSINLACDPNLDSIIRDLNLDLLHSRVLIHDLERAVPYINFPSRDRDRDRDRDRLFFHAAFAEGLIFTLARYLAELDFLKPQAKCALKQIAELSSKTDYSKDRRVLLQQASRFLSLPNLEDCTFAIISDVLNGLLLVKRCKHAAYHLSPNVWKKICLEMLAPL